jgi:hypothetical protein
MKSLKRIIAVFITIKRIASAFLLLTLLTVGLSAQERHEGSARRSRAHTSRPVMSRLPDDAGRRVRLKIGLAAGLVHAKPVRAFIR